jgi:hypothetical protein
VAKAGDQNALDGEGRKLGERTGLDLERRNILPLKTRVVPAVNDAGYVSGRLRAVPVPQGNH